MDPQQHTDILIVGGGAAGVAAAIAASGKGLTVTLLERNAFPGGKATAAEVGTICGLYVFDKDPEPKYIVKGFARTFAEEIQKSSGTVPLFNSEGLHFLPYDIPEFKFLCLEQLRKNNVQVFMDTRVEAITTVKDKIVSVTCTSGEKVIHFTAGAVVDCSGEAVISRLAGIAVIESDRYMAAAQVFTLENITETNEGRLGLILVKALRKAIEEGRVPAYFDRVYIVQGSLKNNCVSLKLGIPVSVNYESGNLEKINEIALDFIHSLYTLITSNIPAFKDAVIKSIAPEVGTRTGVRTMGKYLLTEQDVLGCRKFDDAIAIGSWPVEVWEQNRKVIMRYFNEGDHYHIPAGCLQSAFIPNLFMAGRNISATDEAIASARVIGTCLQTGFAAGYLAAGSISRIGMQDLTREIQQLQLM